MDFSQEMEQIKQQLYSLGFTDKTYAEILELAAEEIMDNALQDLQDKDLSVLESVEAQLIEEPSTIEEADKNISLIFSAAYGDRAEETKQEMLLEYLKDVLEQTKVTKDLIERYQAEDPTAVATIESNKDHPMVQEIMKNEE